MFALQCVESKETNSCSKCRALKLYEILPQSGTTVDQLCRLVKKLNFFRLRFHTFPDQRYERAMSSIRPRQDLRFDGVQAVYKFLLENSVLRKFRYDAINDASSKFKSCTEQLTASKRRNMHAHVLHKLLRV